jgi:hypothetical protein
VTRLDGGFQALDGGGVVGAGVVAVLVPVMVPVQVTPLRANAVGAVLVDGNVALNPKVTLAPLPSAGL